MESKAPAQAHHRQIVGGPGIRSFLWSGGILAGKTPHMTAMKIFEDALLTSDLH